MKWLSQLRTSKQLGWRNCAAVAAHRVALRIGLYQVQLPIDRCPVPVAQAGCKQLVSFSSQPWFVASREACLEGAEALLAGRATWFSDETHEIGSPPDWFLDPTSGQRFPDGRQHWSRSKPFAATDIKRCWELSRWGWAPLFARAWRLTGDSRYLDGLNAWSQSWCQANPVNGGSNWLCGQEASMRLLHALQAWQLSNAPSLLPMPTPERLTFVASHLQRIAATERYAQAQDNNHWTSEAAALFIGGSWLAASAGAYASKGHRWAAKGRRSLERSVAKLVMADGSFAQHSLTYHRLLLDTLIQVDLWRRWIDLPRFSEPFEVSCSAATNWLAAMVDPCSGDGPNLGSNDGAFCYQLHSQSYRDFRPTLQLSSLLFLGQPGLEPGPWDEPLHWLGLISPPADWLGASSPQVQEPVAPKTQSVAELFTDGGYGLLRPTAITWALLRLPKYRFRPAHADPLHLDLWHQGVNLLRDGGSYAYNANEAELSYFPGIESHNSVQFDGSEPMPRLGRFLWGNWLQLEAPPQLELTQASSSITSAYLCPHGRHQRRVEVDVAGHQWRIHDILSGFQSRAVLFWRLAPSDWSLQGTELISSIARLSIYNDDPIERLELVKGYEARFYGTKSYLPVLEIEVKPREVPIAITTEIYLPSGAPAPEMV